MPSYHINRSTHLSQLLDWHGWLRQNSDSSADFSMWCSYGNEPRDADFSLFEHKVTVELDDKKALWELLTEHGLEAMTPATFSQVEDYQNYLSANQLTCHCFLKSTLGAGAEQVHYFNDLNFLARKFEHYQQLYGEVIVQDGVRAPTLLDSQKFKLRAYLVVDSAWNVYLHKSILVIRHLVDYLEASSDPEVHIAPTAGDNAEMLGSYPEISSVVDQVKSISARLIGALANKCRDLEYAGNYGLFGLDFVLGAEQQAMLIEVNAFPNLERNDVIGRASSNAVVEDLFTLLIDPHFRGVQSYPGGFERI